MLWKGYDNPLDLFDAATESLECRADLMAAGSDLVAFVDWLDLSEEQSLTVVAHSFGSVVTGTALADYGLRCTDVVVAGSPGMTVDQLRQLHVETGHFFSEKAPGDTVAELGIFGAASTVVGLRGDAYAHQRAGARARCWPTLHYFEAGSEALENMVAVVTGRYNDIHRYRLVGARDRRRPGVLDPAPPDHAGARRGALLPRPRVPGHDQRPARCRTLGAAQTGNLVREALDEGERAVAWVVRRVGGSWDALQLARREPSRQFAVSAGSVLTGCPFPLATLRCCAAPV